MLSGKTTSLRQPIPTFLRIAGQRPQQENVHRGGDENTVPDLEQNHANVSEVEESNKFFHRHSIEGFRSEVSVMRTTSCPVVGEGA